MIVNEVNKFLALAPLMQPALIDKNACVDPDLADDTAVLYFPLHDQLPLGTVMDMLEDDMEMLLLYHGTKKSNPKIHHCCFFAQPKAGHLMYKINFVTNTLEQVEGVCATIYESVDIWAEELESDLMSHSQNFDFIQALDSEGLLSVFCKMSYEV